MWVWYVIDMVEYWLMVEYAISKTGSVTLAGARIYGADKKYLGWWSGDQMPLVVQNQLKKMIKDFEGPMPSLDKDHVYGLTEKGEAFLKKRPKA